jgi:hypothetical protein
VYGFIKSSLGVGERCPALVGPGRVRIDHLRGRLRECGRGDWRRLLCDRCCNRIVVARLWGLGSGRGWPLAFSAGRWSSAPAIRSLLGVEAVSSAAMASIASGLRGRVLRESFTEGFDTADLKGAKELLQEPAGRGDCPHRPSWRRKQSGANRSLAFPVLLGKYRDQEQAIGTKRWAVVAMCHARGGNR